MPNPTRTPWIWLRAEVDWRGHASVALFDTGGGAVTLPAYDVDADEGLYEDARHLANGFGSSAEDGTAANRRDLPSEMNVAWAAGGSIGTLTCGIDENDLFYVESSLATFSISASADNLVFGYANAVINATGVGPYRATATMDYQRGPIDQAYLTIDPTGAPPAFAVPSYAYQVQNLPTLIRRRGRDAAGAAGAFDIDDAYSTTCLEALHNAVEDATNRRIRHHIDDDNRYVMAAPSALGLIKPNWGATAQAAELRDDLGFTGEEIMQTTGAVDYVRSTNPVAYSYHSSRPWIREPTKHFGESASVDRTTSGGASSVHFGQWIDRTFHFWMDGPDSPNVTDTDSEAHYLDRFLRHARRGHPVAVVVGRDDRRQIYQHDVTEDQPGYDLLYSRDRCGQRWRLERSPDEAGMQVVEYNDPFRAWAKVSMRCCPRRDGT